MLDFRLQSTMRQCRPPPPLPNLGFMAKTAIRGLDWRNIWAAAAAASASHSLCLRELLNNVRRRRRRRQNAEKFESPCHMHALQTSLLNAHARCALMAERYFGGQF